MKNAAIFALLAGASLVAAAPLEKRELVVVTSTTEVVEYVDVTVTITVGPDGTPIAESQPINEPAPAAAQVTDAPSAPVHEATQQEAPQNEDAYVPEAHVEEVKPVQEEPKPVQEEPKPAQEEPKPAQEEPKPEAPAPVVQEAPAPEPEPEVKPEAPVQEQTPPLKYYNMDQVVAQALTIFKQIGTKPSIELLGSMNGSAQNGSRVDIVDKAIPVEPIVANGNGKAVSK